MHQATGETTKLGRTTIDGVAVGDVSDYSLGKQLGRGGMGVVYKLRDENINRDVAIKVMLASIRESSVQTKRFIQEAQITGQLEHPNIVPVHQLGKAEDGSIFYTMKYLQGDSLQQILDRLKRGDKEAIERWPLDALLQVFEKVCDAIAFAHSNGVLHRDLKPENVMVGEYGEVLVVDWGLAKILPGRGGPEVRFQAKEQQPPQHPVQDPSSLTTQAGHLLGTPSYVAPEQIRQSLGPCDERVDVYALGATLYTILTLQPPFRGKLEDVISAKLTGELQAPNERIQAPLSHLPSGRMSDSLSAVTMKAMALPLDQRYQSLSELIAELRAYRAGFATEAEQANFLKILLLMLQRRRNEVALLLASGLIIVLILIASGLSLLDTQNQLRSAEMKAGLLDDQLSRLQMQRARRSDDTEEFQPASQQAHELLASVRRRLQRANPNAEQLPFEPHFTPGGIALNLSDAPDLVDLSALENVPLCELRIDRTGVMDLSPLRGTALRYFSAVATPLVDIEPLAGMPLENVNLAGSSVATIGALVGPALTYLNLRDTPVTLIAPLQNAGNLVGLIAPPDAVDLDMLRNRPNLKFVSYQNFGEPAELFWRVSPEGPP